MSREHGDSLYVRGMLRDYWAPAAVEARRQAHEAIAALIIAGADCPECFSPQGEPCRGLSQGYHAPRGFAYAKKG